VLRGWGLKPAETLSGIETGYSPEFGAKMMGLKPAETLSGIETAQL